MFSQLASSVAGFVLGSYTSRQKFANELLERVNTQFTTSSFGSLDSIRIDGVRVLQGSIRSFEEADLCFVPSGQPLHQVDAESVVQKIAKYGSFILPPFQFLARVEATASEAKWLGKAENIVTEGYLTTFITYLQSLLLDSNFARFAENKVEEFSQAIEEFKSLSESLTSMAVSMIFRDERWMKTFKKLSSLLTCTENYFFSRNGAMSCFEMPKSYGARSDALKIVDTIYSKSNDYVFFQEDSSGNVIMNNSEDEIYLKVEGAIRARSYFNGSDPESWVLSPGSSKIKGSLLHLKFSYAEKKAAATVEISNQEIDITIPESLSSNEALRNQVTLLLKEVSRLEEGYGPSRDASLNTLLKLLQYNVPEKAIINKERLDALIEKLPTDAISRINSIYEQYSRDRDVKDNDAAQDTIFEFLIVEPSAFINPSGGVLVSDAYYEDEILCVKAKSYLEIIPRSFGVRVVQVDSSDAVGSPLELTLFNTLASSVQPVKAGEYPLPVARKYYTNIYSSRFGTNLLTSILNYDGKGGDYNADNLGGLGNLFETNGDSNLLLSPSEVFRRLLQFKSIYSEYPWMFAFKSLENDAEANNILQQIVAYQSVSGTAGLEECQSIARRYCSHPKLKQDFQFFYKEVMSNKFALPFTLNNLVSYVYNGKANLRKQDLVAEIIVCNLLLRVAENDPNFKHGRLIILAAYLINNMTYSISSDLVGAVTTSVRMVFDTKQASTTPISASYLMALVDTVSTSLDDSIFRDYVKELSI